MSKNCPICKSKSLALISNRVWDTPKRKVYQCSNCEVVFLNPMITGSALEDFYSNYNKYEKTREPNRKEYLSKEKKEIEAAQRRCGLFKKYLKKGHTICEIGASHGYFLDLVKSKVKGMVAIEPSPKEHADLKRKKIESFNWLEELPDNLKFDSVFMFHTFEHLPDPVGYLKNLKRHLRPKAKIFIEVPNFSDALLSRYKIEEFKQFYFQSMHPFYYKEKTLADVFKRSGFKPIGCFHIQRYPFSNHLSWLLDRKPGGNLSYEKKFRSINKKYRDILESEKITDTITSIFQAN